MLLVTAGAQAAPKLAALTPALRPTATPELRDRFHEAVTRGLTQAGYDTVPAAEVRMRLAISEEQASCNSAGVCAARAAMTLHTDHLLASEVVIAGKDYTLRLRILDSAGREIAKAEETCDICTVKEADEALTRAAAKLATAARMTIGASEAPPPPPPPPKPVEPTPPPRVVEPPPPRPVEPVAQPVVTPPPSDKPTEKKGFPWRWVAVGSLAVGVVGLAVGIPLVVIDGQPTCDPGPGKDPKKFCKEVYNTAGGGGTLLALGAAGVAASAVLFYLDYRARHRPPTRVSVVPLLEGGVLATVGGRF